MIFLFLAQKSLLDFWDRFLPSLAYSILCLGLVACMALTPQLAGPAWPLVLFFMTFLWVILGNIFLVYFHSGNFKIPSRNMMLLGLGWAFFLGSGLVALGYYWSSTDYFFWFLGFFVFWILLFAGTLLQIIGMFLILGDLEKIAFKDLLGEILGSPGLLVSFVLLQLISLITLIIMVPGPGLGLQMSLATRKILLDKLANEAGTSLTASQSWKIIIEKQKKDLRQRTWTNLLFPWRD